jgi:hypothetical protein
METRWGKVQSSTKQAPAAGFSGSRTFERTDYFLFDGRRATQRPLSREKTSRGSGWGAAMKYALESVTLATFAVFLAWSVKILMAWV